MSSPQWSLIPSAVCGFQTIFQESTSNFRHKVKVNLFLLLLMFFDPRSGMAGSHSVSWNHKLQFSQSFQSQQTWFSSKGAEKERKRERRQTAAIWNFPLHLWNYLQFPQPRGPAQFENCFWPQLNYIRTDFCTQGSLNYVLDIMKSVNSHKLLGLFE